MIYLDYSATTPVNEFVLESFNQSCVSFANPNSTHKLGIQSKELIDKYTTKISKLLNVKESEIIYTSGSSEANNLAIIGLAEMYPEKKQIITTKFEHSSVLSPTAALQKLGYDIDFIETDSNGIIKMDSLKSLISDNTLLVSTIAVNSEIGIIQPINKIGELLKTKDIYYHVDATQAIGKIKIDLTNIDLLSLTAHKIYGIKGIGCLIKKEGIKLSPMIHGGKSTTKYRSGTPCTQLIVSLAKALEISFIDINKNFDYVTRMNLYIREKICNYENILINSPIVSSPYILNISIINHDAKIIQDILSEKEIYISTKSACSSNTSKSIQILGLYNDIKRATSSIRISISYLTTKNEIDIVIEELIKLAER
jgi:cysteine desulfurase